MSMKPTPSRMPAIGRVIAFRSTAYEGLGKQPRYLSGRVVAVNDAEVIVSAPDRSPRVYVLRRARAHWKGHDVPIGRYRGTPLWPAIEAAGLVPRAWAAPFATAPRTLARLREVQERLKIIAGFPLTVEERASRTAAAPGRIRGDIAHEQDAEVAAYLRDVLAADDGEIAMAEYQRADADVRAIVGGRCFGRREDRRPMPSLDEVLAELPPEHRREHIEQAYGALAERLAEVDERTAAREALSARWRRLEAAGWTRTADGWIAPDVPRYSLEDAEQMQAARDSAAA